MTVVYEKRRKGWRRVEGQKRQRAVSNRDERQQKEGGRQTREKAVKLVDSLMK